MIKKGICTKHLVCLCQASCNELVALPAAWIGWCSSLGMTTHLYSLFSPKRLSAPMCARPGSRLAPDDGSCIGQVEYTRALELDGFLLGKNWSSFRWGFCVTFPGLLFVQRLEDAGWCEIGQREPLLETVLGLHRLFTHHWTSFDEFQVQITAKWMFHSLQINIRGARKATSEELFTCLFLLHLDISSRSAINVN